jgi:uncharacterized membrane protein YdfJ with MMPL/SSD domain
LNVLSVSAAYGVVTLIFQNTCVARSGGVVTSAAAVMVAVFAIFGTLSSLEMKELGVGLASAVLLDATLVRGILLPAVLAMLGKRAHTGPACYRSCTTRNRLRIGTVSLAVP